MSDINIRLRRMRWAVLRVSVVARFDLSARQADFPVDQRCTTLEIVVIRPRRDGSMESGSWLSIASFTLGLVNGSSRLTQRSSSPLAGSGQPRSSAAE